MLYYLFVASRLRTKQSIESLLITSYTGEDSCNYKLYATLSCLFNQLCATLSCLFNQLLCGGR